MSTDLPHNCFTFQNASLVMHMTIVAESFYGASESFKVTVTYTPGQTDVLHLRAFERETQYQSFTKCAEADGVDPELCVCNTNVTKTPTLNSTAAENVGLQSHFFGRKDQKMNVSEFRVHEGSIPGEIVIIERQISSNKNVVYTAVNRSNMTAKFQFHVTAEHCDVSGKNNVLVTLLAGDIQFLAVVVAWKSSKSCNAAYTVTAVNAS